MPIVYFVTAWALVYLAVYFVSESAQKFLYDRTLDGLWWRALLGALPLAALILWAPVRFEDMFTASFVTTFLQLVAWSLIFWLALGYQAPHGITVGGISFLIMSTFITMALDSLRGWASGPIS